MTLRVFHIPRGNDRKKSKGKGRGNVETNNQRRGKGNTGVSPLRITETKA